MGSAENFEIIDAADHVDSGVRYSPGLFSETESVPNLSSLDTLVHVHIEALARGRERPEINLFADLETTKASSRHLDTLANVEIDVPTKTNRTEIPRELFETARRLDTLAQVHFDVPTNLRQVTPNLRTEIHRSTCSFSSNRCPSNGKNLADNWTPQQSCSPRNFQYRWKPRVGETGPRHPQTRSTWHRAGKADHQHMGSGSPFSPPTFPLPCHSPVRQVLPNLASLPSSSTAMTSLSLSLSLCFQCAERRKKCGSTVKQQLHTKTRHQ